MLVGKITRFFPGGKKILRGKFVGEEDRIGLDKAGPLS
jgi:hypothetical protein